MKYGDGKNAGLSVPRKNGGRLLALACFQPSDLRDDAVLDCSCDCSYEGGDDDRGVLRVKTDLRVGNENEVLR